ncbi:LysR family transcriptional regulator [Novosphingobium profundi]|uniref:LysR family transcriptional regulator n=1 Tax=Novosphingobium profundi TaxID=1774954 RepID=UPI001BD9C053|nr:LysR family transcriptional regulator [Novosphingobium profundi]
MIPITFRQLEVFVRVAEAGSFRAAAEQLSITPVSVSEHVRALEWQLGCTLFERRRGSASPLTHMGERVFRQARSILSSTVDMLATFDRVPIDRLRRRIRIGAHGFIAESFARKVARFIREHPDVDISLERRSYAEIVSGLAQGEIEIGYFLSVDPVPELESFVAWEEPMALFVGAQHPLAERAHVEPEELEKVPFVYLPSRTHLRGEIASMFASLGMKDPPAALTTDDHHLIADHLMEADSFACLFADWNSEAVKQGKLAPLAFARRIPPMQIRCTVRGAYRTDRTVRMMLDAFNQTTPAAHV